MDWRTHEAEQVGKLLAHQAVIKGYTVKPCDVEHVPLHKGWRLQTNVAGLAKLTLTCTGEHANGQRRGDSATRSGLYTDEFVEHVIQGLLHLLHLSKNVVPVTTSFQGGSTSSNATPQEIEAAGQRQRPAQHQQ